MRTFKLYLFLLTTLFCSQAVSQNLIRNGSFEELDSCPVGRGNLNYAKYWSYFNLKEFSSPDFFHECVSNYSVGVPFNISGIQESRTGKGYAGIAFENKLLREYLVHRLEDRLRAGSRYCFSFYMSPAEGSLNYMPNIQIMFSDSLCLTPKWPYTSPCDYSQIVNYSFPNFLNDTSGWTHVSGSYIASGHEDYFIIGFCFDLAKNPPSVYFGDYFFDHFVYLIYIYIDDIALYECNTQPVVSSPGPDRHLCPGDSLQLQVGYCSQCHYRWYDKGSPADTLSVAHKLKVSPAKSTSYIVEMIDFKYDYFYDTVRVFVDESFCKKPTYKMYPNPTQSEITFEFSSIIPDNAYFELFDVIGRRVLIQKPIIRDDVRTTTFYLNHLAPGVYCCRIWLGNTVLGVEKIVKQ